MADLLRESRPRSHFFHLRGHRGVVIGVGTADGGDPELVLMRRPLVDMQLCLLLCYLGASHRDPGGVIMPAGQGAEGA